MDVSAQLRSAVNDAIDRGATRYSIAKGAGVKYSTFVRWLDENRDIRLSTVSQLATFLGLELRAIDLPAKAKTKAPAVDWSEPKKKPKRRR